MHDCVWLIEARIVVHGARLEQHDREHPQQADLAGDEPNAKDLRESENKMALARFRNTAEAVSRLPSQVKFRTVLASFFKVLLESPRLRKMLVDMSSGKPPAETLDRMSQEPHNFLVPARENLAKILACRDIAPVHPCGSPRTLGTSCSGPCRRSLRLVEVRSERGAECKPRKFGKCASCRLA